MLRAPRFSSAGRIFFANAVSAATESISSASSMVTAVYFPRELLVVSAVLVRFVMDRRIGPHTRIVRSVETFRDACKQSRGRKAV